MGFPVKTKHLLNNPIRVVNLGLKSFARDLKERGVQVVHVAWRPPAGADSNLAKLLSKLGN
ncbi:MAG: fdrA domain protein [SAR324 cluster bacterium]|nr:fdrA domain protein [SAR324 cluster bacterium]